MKWIFSHKNLVNTAILMVFSWVFCFVSIGNIQASSHSQPDENRIVFEQLKLNQHGITPKTEYSHAFSVRGCHSSSAKETNKRLSAALSNNNLNVTKQYVYLLHRHFAIGIKVCTSILLYPFHYFW
ncbi:hypothetical protein KDU71_06940 [Carboxylicivirga sediminis]|uniref:Uncharacterized protein n=1 Tax=Carboxylicivirga sediminis TaxID=2006564 RepID=A0A941IXD7_9BACT|nr:hypothetical protein [Carboxylicivirga sediminis]MBR8535289.1 hypothetical protein [Carboxylicivirga sediminis]